MIEMRNLNKSFGDLKVLKDIDLEIGKGQVLSIIGPSGTGKSTLLRCINYLEVPDSGSLKIDNLYVDFEKINKDEIHKLRESTAMVFQNFNLFNNKTCLENITEALIVVKGFKKEEANAMGEDILKRIGLLDKKNTYPSKLSGGQKQRIGIGRAIALDPKVLLFDEPTSALDPELVGEVLDLIKDLAKGNMTMIIVTHEMSFAKNISDKLAFMDEGKIIEIDSPDILFNNPKNFRTKQFLERFNKSI